MTLSGAGDMQGRPANPGWRQREDEDDPPPGQFDRPEPERAEVIEAQEWQQRSQPDPGPPKELPPPLPPDMKTFEVAISAPRPVPFKIVARPTEDAPPGTQPEEFVMWANSAAGAGGIFSMADLVVIDRTTGQSTANLNAFNAFFRRVLLYDGFETWLSILERPDIEVDMTKDVRPVVDWLMGLISGKPLRQPRR